MYRISLLAAVMMLSLGIGGAAAQADKKKEELTLGKTVGEWTKILREDERPKMRQIALLALEGSTSAGRVALGAVLEALEKDKEPQVRLDVVRLLGRLGKDVRPAFKALLGALQTDKSDAVREAAATVIGDKFADQAKDYVTVLGEALKDPHAGTRIAVAGALRNLGEDAQPAFPALLTAAKNPKETALVRVAALHVLSRHAQENAQTLPLLLDLVKNTDNPLALREAAIEGLGRSGRDDADLIGALSAALADKNVELRKAAAISLGSMGVKAKAAWPAVKPRLDEKAEPEAAIRNHLIRLAGALGKIHPDAIPLLTNAAEKDKSTENRIAAIQELAELGPFPKDALYAADTISALTMLAANDARAAIRDAAAKALKQIKPRP